MMHRLVAAASLATGVLAGTTIWDGSFSNYPTVAAFDQWSWADEVGNYQWYIHGSGATSEYLALDPSYKNPASSETHGLRVTIDGTSHWNGQTMERTEIIPQTTANLGTGQLYYHFSISRDDILPPEVSEHQILFFESHFTEMKYGVSPNGTYLEWHVSSQPQWGVPFEAGQWLNFAYDIDFSAGTVGLWASSGSDPLVKVHANIAASTSTNSEDWHVGVLRIASDNTAENFYFSGVYIENAPITTSIGTGSGSGSPPASSSGPTTSAAPTTTVGSTTAPSSTSSAAGPAQTKYGQCGGTGWTGPTTCASGSTCTAVSPPYYSQCL